MSQYLTLTLKHKEDKDKSIELVSYPTSIARELSEESVFPYQEEDKLIGKGFLDKAILEAKAYISACVRYKDECQEHINKNNSLIAKCETKQSVESLMEYNRDYEESIAEEKAEIEKWQGIIHDIEFVINILERNEDYELYYSNC